MSWGRWVLVGVALVAQIGAASPTPDLAGYLVDAPSFSWIEQVRSSHTLEGEFSADEYGTYGQSTTAAANLKSRGFVRGFGREWAQIQTDDYLVERVFQFGDATGATDWLRGVQAQSVQGTEYLGDIAEASAIPNAFGVRRKLSGGGTQWRIDFVKDNLVFVVHADADTNDLSSLALGQANAIYKRASGAVPASAPSARSLPSWFAGALIGTSVLIVILVGAAVVAALLLTRRTRRSPVPSSVQMSPDGAYWWDGARWRQVATDPPPNPTP